MQSTPDKPLLDVLRANAPLAWFLDYDGTLTDIVEQPEAAFISEARLEQLKALIASQPYVAIVSGRSVAQLKNFLGKLAGLPTYFCGMHGGEIWNVETETWLRRPPEELQTLVTTLQATLTEHELPPGVMLENKGFSLAMHTRHASLDAISQAHEVFQKEALALDVSGRMLFKHGKCVLEWAPSDFHKGGALALLTRQFREATPALTPVYFGDDITDEDGFRAANTLGGMSVRVGAPAESTDATYALETVDEVYELINTVITARTPG